MLSLAKETAGVKPARRSRPPSSCEPCRTRKLKCDRAFPCDTCVKRNKQSVCKYSENATRNKPKHDSTGERLRNLENAVLQIMQTGVAGVPLGQDVERRTTNPSLPGDSTLTDLSSDSLTENHGTLHVQDGQVAYFESSHWLSILQDIKEVREELSLSSPQINEDTPPSDINPQTEVDLVFGLVEPPNISDILEALPARSVCDSLLSQYFNSQFLIIPILHPLQFQQEYDEFWKDPSKSPIIWVGLLFSILGITSSLRYITNMATELGEYSLSPKTFQLRTAQCLIIGKYSNAKAYGLETLVLHLQSKFLGLTDSNADLWFLMGIIIRLAIRMGYHRDSKRHPSISAFDGEMRRRVWAIIFQVDALMSFQIGLPSMIPSEHCDTELPRNLTFSDFAPDTIVLPPSRPLTDHTQILYSIAKGKIMTSFKKIVTYTQSLSLIAFETTAILDTELREAYKNLPLNYRMKTVGGSFMDTPSIIMQRCSIELLFLKGIIVLYRPYLNKDPSNLSFAQYRSSCLDAALQILSRQADLHQASQPGGQLHGDRWMVSSLTSHDFLLAAMVVCLELSVHRHTTPASSHTFLARLFDALQISKKIWDLRSPESKEARTAAQVLDLMIRTVENDSITSTTSLVTSDKNHVPLDEGSFSYAEPVAEMINGSESLDWMLLDQYLQNVDGSGGFASNLDTYSEGMDRDIFQGADSEWMT